MKKRHIILMILAVMLALCLCSCKGNGDFEDARKGAVDFLNTNEGTMAEKFDKALFEQGALLTSGEFEIVGDFRGYTYYYYNTDYTTYIELVMSTTTGQQFGLIYCPTNDLLGENRDFLTYDESKDGIGNTAYVREKLRENWYFFYNDFEGKLDVDSIKKFK